MRCSTNNTKRSIAFRKSVSISIMFFGKVYDTSSYVMFDIVVRCSYTISSSISMFNVYFDVSVCETDPDG